MSIETNDGGLLKAIGTVIIPAAAGQPIGFIGQGIRSLETNTGGQVILELVEALSVTEFHGLATFASSNDPPAGVGTLNMVWINTTHFRIDALGAISEDNPCSVFFAVRRITPTALAGTNNIGPA